MNFKRAPLIAYLCILPLLVGLGIWQFNRAEEKRMLIASRQKGEASASVILNGVVPSDWQAILYKNAEMKGRYDVAHQYLLDNQIYRGKAGYFVLTPFAIEGTEKSVLVNRGWLPLGTTREDIPDIRINDSPVKISGRINRFPSVGLKLSGAEIPTKTWPAMLQVVDVDVISRQLGYVLMPFQIELDKSAANGYVREWKETALMPPEKHVAYAVQWFLLAITLTFLLIKYGRHKANDEPRP